MSSSKKNKDRQQQQLPIVRSRKNVRSQRRRDGLIRFAADQTSQNGEDGIIHRIFELLPPPPPTSDNDCAVRWLVDVGAWDGVHLSNTHSLLFGKQGSVAYSSSVLPWRGVLIEADRERCDQLVALHASSDSDQQSICLNISVSIQGQNSLSNILSQQAEELPKQFDFLCIDIDGSDYWVLNDMLLNGGYRPQVICIEFNPTMPDDLVYIPEADDSVRHGASLSALVELAEEYEYVLVETTLFNAFFVRRHLYEQNMKDLVPDTSIEALHEMTMGTSLYQLYDGTLKLWGCKKMLWHRIAMDEGKMQMLSPTERTFPFAPSNDGDKLPSTFDTSQAVDLGPYCGVIEHESDHQQRQQCATELFQQLQDYGFCLIRGTGMDRIVCRNALNATDAFLQQADEDVRRSCLAKDRARRGYSPMNVENFASLIGENGPNDLVRKFRMGPKSRGDGDGDKIATTTNSLLQPNVWPTEEVWHGAFSFRCDVEDYYETACTVAQSVVRAICDGLLLSNPELQTSLEPLLAVEDSSSTTTSSILTLLSYRPGTRHKGKNKGPLVAAHTDVGVITMLLFDRSTTSCATLQRSDGNGGWIDVELPSTVPDDPIFVVNVADCFSELSQGKVPSTLHRVVAKRGSSITRNCCALFVGLEPDAQLRMGDEKMSYEEWRKRRIARAQCALKQIC